MIKRIRNLIVSVKNYLFVDLWGARTGKESHFSDWIIKQLKILMITIKGFMEDNVAIRASALTYYSLLSVIPIVAMVFGIAKGFGFDKLLRIELRNRLQGQKEVFDWIITFSNRMLEHTKGELIAGVGLVILVWSVMKVLSNVERAFNDIWQIKKGRKLNRKLSDYFAIILISPIFFVLSSSATVYITTHIHSISHSLGILGFFGPVINFLINLVPYVLIWFLFTFVYIAIPNTKVKFSSALIAGIIAGTMFQIVQILYLRFQISVSNYNAVYGSFAALPLFMIWLQIAWFIVLFGAELSFATQNFRKYEFERVFVKISHKTKIELSLLITSFLCKRFAKGEPPATIDDISASLDISNVICKEIVFKLNETRVISEVMNSSGFNTYQPATDLNHISIKFVVDRVESYGIELDSLQTNDQYQKLTAHLGQFNRFNQLSDANILLKDL